MWSGVRKVTKQANTATEIEKRKKIEMKNSKSILGAIQKLRGPTGHTGVFALMTI